MLSLSEYLFIYGLTTNMSASVTNRPPSVHHAKTLTRILFDHQQKLREALARLAKLDEKENIFSRESFQTFSEAYDIARETIERKKREQKGWL